MKPTKIKQALQKSINDVARRNQLYCANNNITWTHKHNECLKESLIDFYCDGVWPILKEIFELDEQEVMGKKR